MEYSKSNVLIFTREAGADASPETKKINSVPVLKDDISAVLVVEKIFHFGPR